MFVHQRMNSMLKTMAQRIVDRRLIQLKNLNEATLTGIFSSDIAQHYQHLAAIEISNCKYISSHWHKLKFFYDARRFHNDTLVINATVPADITITINPGKRIDVSEYQQWVVSLQASIFSSVCASVTLFVVLLATFPTLRRVFFFR